MPAAGGAVLLPLVELEPESVAMRERESISSRFIVMARSYTCVCHVLLVGCVLVSSLAGFDRSLHLLCCWLVVFLGGRRGRG